MSLSRQNIHFAHAILVSNGRNEAVRLYGSTPTRTAVWVYEGEPMDIDPQEEGGQEQDVEDHENNEDDEDDDQEDGGAILSPEGPSRLVMEEAVLHV